MNQSKKYLHVPIMTDEVVLALNIEDGGSYLDCTFGRGGHALAMLSKNPNISLTAIDVDQDAKNAFDLIADNVATSNLHFIHMNFVHALKELMENNLKFDGILFDFGVSTDQVMGGIEGMSFQSDSLLDMRIDPKNNDLTAWKVVNEYPRDILEEILRTFSDEKLAKPLVSEIINERSCNPISGTKQLASIAKRVYARFYGSKSRRHPATKLFQAIRVEVNGEINNIFLGLGLAVKLIKPGGRLCTITFHGAENSAVKQCLSRYKLCFKQLRSLGGSPSRSEILSNPSARSATLKVFERKEVV